MARLSTHLPQLAALALAVAAAAVSHWVHVDRSASSRTGPRTQLVEPTAAPGKRRSGSASDGNKARHRRADRRVRGAESPGKGPRASRFREPQEPLDRPVLATVTAHPPHARRPRHVDRLRALPGVARGVDPALQRLIDDKHPGGDSERPADEDNPPLAPPTPWPAAPAPPAPAAPDSSATSSAPTDADAESGSSDDEPDTGGTNDGTGTAAHLTMTEPGTANPDGETGNADHAGGTRSTAQTTTSSRPARSEVVVSLVG